MPDSELQACLSALRKAVVEAKRIHAVSQREGMVTGETPFVFSSFNWRPKAAQRLDTPLLGPETPIEEIPLRASVHQVLKELGIFRIEDLSAISESELLSEESIGRGTITRLREALAQAGMAFSPDPDATRRALDQTRAVLALSPEARASALRGLKDSSPLSSLGLKPTTLTRALGGGHLTVGALRKLSLTMICESFGKREAREVYEALMLTDRPFAGSATPLDLWRHGLVETHELAAPTAAHAPVEELRPWLGTSVDALQARGIHTLGALRSLVARQEVTSSREFGRTTTDRIFAFLDAYVVAPPYRRGAIHRAAR
ncbi:hypothetical protein [Variovorax sp. YR216]|uniref:hypothetical protein n=1 Tax=Variovorax sp. YR216 TaxID=1882828 RepID=UPI000898E302|nr:hypothetical protein [Variovorax sp. YR216]SEA98358.1 hypothetical protein SAMN05444680_10512 [Variovorax sp. YR216]